MNYHTNIRWNTTQLKRASLKCIYQISFANWNGLKEASGHLFTWSLAFFLLMSMGNCVIPHSHWIYCSINPTGFSVATSDLHSCERRIKSRVYSWEFVSDHWEDEAFSMHREGCLAKISSHSVCIVHLVFCFEYSVNALYNRTHINQAYEILNQV